MRVVWLWAVLAGLLAALTGPSAAADSLARRGRELMREHPEIWTGAVILRGERSLIVAARRPGLPARITLPDVAARPGAEARFARPAAAGEASGDGTAVVDDVSGTGGAAAFGGSGGGSPVPAGSAGSGVPGGEGDSRSRDLADLARRADRASLVAGRLLGPVRPVILVPATTEQAATLSAPASVTGLAAVAAVDSVIVEPAAFARLSAAGRDVVLTHEITHIAAGAALDGRTPKWLVEGFADYVGYRDSGIPVARAAAELAEEVRAGRLPRELPGPGDFAAGSPRLAQAYEEAWLACRYVAERYGERALVALYRAARGGDLSAALSRTLGTGPAGFTAAWRAYVQDRLR
ncbi:hypothetical protein Sme01_00910 [Sphaerisporangium melleum]|uniref:Peptidase MA-like domain-containing protein n=1 Tax=Sphaerisporangium melleum TaxID=321316 RepID=A0A917R3D0_9ACTN|nr:hypothetical protein [Sphaerisporangium melleum]GGK88086.1 hypothetical protein GCM10007964_33230 [Sphaerisporangium melleum]GII67615.1 hypothetical protein Sme01_00910 [Sphaerisporangium melleum]